MKANFFLGADAAPKFRLEDAALPALQPNEVLVKTMSCGICGTDVHIYHGGKGSADVTPPVVLGHEFAGIVEAVGSAVSTIRVGDHVALDPNMYCGTCRPCRMGKKQNCEHLFALGVNTNGGFAQYCVCPDTQCYQLNKDIPFDVGAMAEPLACAIHGVDKAGIRSGETVLVIGGGPIGLMMVQLAKLAGAGTVVLSEPVAMRRELGLQLGADCALDPTQEALPEADVVIECVGNPRAAQQAIAAAAPGATVLLFSVPPFDATIPLPLYDIFSKELTIVGSKINPDTHQRAVNLINSGRIELAPLISHRYPLAQLEDAILMQMDSCSIKVIVHPQE